MAWATPPVLAVGDVLTASDWNTVSGDLSVLATYLGAFGVGTPITGSAPTAGTPVLLLQAGQASANTNSSSELSYSFPQQFPTGLLGVAVSGVTAGANDQYFLTVDNTRSDAIALVAFVAFANAASSWNVTPAASVTITFTYIAIGF
jgi:hypothetical protein